MAQNQGKIRKFWIETKRIFTIAKKPTRKEFNLTVKICLVGLLIIGGLSYAIQLIASSIQRAPVTGT
ncbi:MAG: protein translocase SEC61 complex subunit gamma [Promethearchaeota archaeon]